MELGYSVTVKPPPATIKCPGCKLWLSPRSYYKSRGRRPYGLSSRCKKCDRKRLDAIVPKKKASEEQSRIWANSSLKKKFGITYEQYLELVEAAGGVCEICHKPESQIHHTTGEPQRLAVDHDATTGTIRGILCSRCNRGIGFLQHDLTLLTSAAKYLSRNEVVIS